MGGLINLLSGSGQASEMANARQGTQGAGFRTVFGIATQTGGKASDQPLPTPSVLTPRATLLDRLGEVRERALANVGQNQVESQGQKDASGGLSGLVSSLALAVAEFDQDTGLGLAPALQSGLTPELAAADPAAIPDTLGGEVPEVLNDSLQALVAVIGFVERTARVLPLPPVGLPGIQLADGSIVNANNGASIAQGESIPETASISATTGKAAGVLAGNPPIAGNGRGETAEAKLSVTSGEGGLASDKTPTKSPVVVPTTGAAQNQPPVAYAATLTQEAVSAGTVSMLEQPRPGLLRGAETGALVAAGEPGTVRNVVAPARTRATQQVGLGGGLQQAGDAAAARPAEAGAIGSQTSPAVVSDPRLVPFSVGLPGAADPAPALLGQVVAQAFTALETVRERGVGLTRERPLELNPLSGSEMFLRAQPGTDRPALERAAANGAPNRSSRFAAALTAQIQATEGRTLIELSPRGLGQVEVDIRTEADGTMKVTIRADNLMVLNTLRDAREMLAQSIGGADGAVLDFQEGSPGQDQGRQGPALTQGVTGDDKGSATTTGPIAESEVIGGGQLDIMT